MGTNQKVDEVYGLSAEIFADIVKKTNGDPEALRKLLEAAQRDPAGFYNSLDQNSKDKVKDLSGGINSSPSTQ